MRLEKLQAYLRDKGQEYRYTEEDGCGSIDWEHRGLMYCGGGNFPNPVQRAM